MNNIEKTIHSTLKQALGDIITIKLRGENWDYLHQLLKEIENRLCTLVPDSHHHVRNDITNDIGIDVFIQTLKDNEGTTVDLSDILTKIIKWVKQFGFPDDDVKMDSLLLHSTRDLTFVSLPLVLPKFLLVVNETIDKINERLPV